MKTKQPRPRPISVIALDIRSNWKRVNYAAVPYLDAMLEIDSLDDVYWFESARSIVLRFLSNAGTFRGEHARRLKGELKTLLGGV